MKRHPPTYCEQFGHEFEREPPRHYHEGSSFKFLYCRRCAAIAYPVIDRPGRRPGCRIQDWVLVRPRSALGGDGIHAYTPGA
jgi:hypothetical protein